jgi:hypothetical protein
MASASWQPKSISPEVTYNQLQPARQTIQRDQLVYLEPRPHQCPFTIFHKHFRHLERVQQKWGPVLLKAIELAQIA